MVTRNRQLVKIRIIQNTQFGATIGLDFKYTSIDPLKIPAVSPKASVCTVSLIADTLDLGPIARVFC